MLLLGPLFVPFLPSVPCEVIVLKLHRRREVWKGGEITRTVFSPHTLLARDNPVLFATALQLPEHAGPIRFYFQEFGFRTQGSSWLVGIS